MRRKSTVDVGNGVWDIDDYYFPSLVRFSYGLREKLFPRAIETDLEVYSWVAQFLSVIGAISTLIGAFWTGFTVFWIAFGIVMFTVVPIAILLLPFGDDLVRGGHKFAPGDVCLALFASVFVGVMASLVSNSIHSQYTAENSVEVPGYTVGEIVSEGTDVCPSDDYKKGGRAYHLSKDGNQYIGILMKENGNYHLERVCKIGDSVDTSDTSEKNPSFITRYGMMDKNE